MDVEKEAKVREIDDVVAKKWMPPPMAGRSVGPQITPGPKGPVGNHAVAPVPAEPASVETDKRSRIAQLPAMMVLKVELLSTKKKLAEMDERMGFLAVQDARKRMQELNKEESELMAAVSRQLGMSAGSSIKLVDRDRGLCQIE